MQISCPTCKNTVNLMTSPVRGNSNDGSEAWVCLRCDAIVCVDCYHQHSRDKHPEMTKEIKKPKKK